MFGQGSPWNALRFDSIGLKTRLGLVLMCALILPAAAAARTAPPSPPQDRSDQVLRLRVYWGGGKQQQWQGGIQLAEGQFANPQLLGVSGDAAGSVLCAESGLQINHWSPVNYGGVDVDVPYSPTNQLKLNLGVRDNPDVRIEETIPLSDLVQGSYNKSIDTDGNRCVIARAPGDRLPIAIAREHLIFEPKERFQFGLRVNHIDWNLQKVNCKIRLQPASAPHADHPMANLGAAITANFQDQEQSRTLVFDLDPTGSSTEQMVDWSLPPEEGVYTFTIELSSPWQQASLKPRSIVRRQMQVVVLDGKRPLESENRPWRTIATIDPGRESTNSTHSLRVLGKRNDPHPLLGNDQRRQVKIESQPMLELQVGGWQAVPIEVTELNRPHAIEVEYLADQPATIGFSILEPNAKGQTSAYGLDSGLHIPPSLIEVYPRTEQRLRKKHRIVFWPQEKLSYLMITNRDNQYPAVLAKIEVSTGPDRLPSQTPSRVVHPFPVLDFSSPQSQNGVHLPSDKPPRRRHFLAFSEAGLFAKNFGAREGIDPVGGSFDDWQTFYNGADRFIQHLKSNGYTGAVVTVATDGSALYPTRFLGNSPRLDTGMLFSTAQDPMRKDVLELLFRLCEREGLTLVPAMMLNGPLPEIERERNGAEGSDQGAALVHWNGAQAERVGKTHFPIYNPLHHRVQDQVVQAVDELAARYQRFTAFGGIAIICRPDTYALLPGQQWGYDNQTLQEFLASAGENGELLQNREQALEYVLGPQLERWFQWRAQSMANWYRELSQALRKHRPADRVLLAPVEIYRNEELEAVLAPTLHASVDYRRQMLRVGWDAGQLATLDGVQVLKPRRMAPTQSLAKNRHEISIENQRHADDFYHQVGAVGELFVHRVPWAHFSQLQTLPPFQQSANSLMRLQPTSPAALWNRQRFLNALRSSDNHYWVDGGQLVLTGQEQELRELIAVFNQLPAVAFAEVPLTDTTFKGGLSQLPAVIRQHEGREGTWFYVVNASPWPVTVRAQLKSRDGNASAAALQMLTDLAVQEKDANGSRILEFEIGPLSLTGGLLAAGQALENYQFDLPVNAADRLRKQVHVLQAKLLRSANSPPMEGLQNGDFEISGQPSLSGWEFGQQGTEGISLKNEDAAAGKASLRITNNQETPVWIRSNPFPLPETGRLSISVWLRTPDLQTQPPVRISIEGANSEVNYYRFGSIGKLSPDPKLNQLNDRWQRFALHFDDLPIERLSQIRVGIDLMGPGDVEVDRFEIFDRWFDERDAKAINQRLAISGPLLANPVTYESCRLQLGSYWLRFLDEMVEDAPASPIASESSPDSNRNGTVTGSNEPADVASAKGETDSSAEANERGLFRRIRRSGNRLSR